MEALSLDNKKSLVDFGQTKTKVIEQINQDLKELGAEFLKPFLYLKGEVKPLAFYGQDAQYVIDLDPSEFQIRELFKKTIELFRLNDLEGAAAIPLDDDVLLVIFYQDDSFAVLAGQSKERVLTTRDFKVKELQLLSESL